jgi:hypothetical protein
MSFKVENIWNKFNTKYAISLYIMSKMLERIKEMYTRIAFLKKIWKHWKMSAETNLHKFRHPPLPSRSRKSQRWMVTRWYFAAHLLASSRCWATNSPDTKQDCINSLTNMNNNIRTKKITRLVIEHWKWFQRFVFDALDRRPSWLLSHRRTRANWSACFGIIFQPRRRTFGKHASSTWRLLPSSYKSSLWLYAYIKRKQKWVRRGQLNISGRKNTARAFDIINQNPIKPGNWDKFQILPKCSEFYPEFIFS